MTLGLLELAVGYREGLNISSRKAESELPATPRGDMSEVVKDVEPELKAEDQSPAQNEGCDCSGLKSRMGGARLSTEPLGRPESGRKKKQQWRYQRSYRIKSKTGPSYSSTRN